MAKSKETSNESELKELFVDGLKDIYWAEKHLTKELAKMGKSATSQQLRTAFEQHLTETENQVGRLEQVFEALGEKASAKKCEAMEGLIEEAHELIEDTKDGSLTRDVALIAAAQKVEHYEIASYGTLRTLAGVLGFPEAAKLLEQTLEEEKKTDSLLTRIAETSINESAKSE
ncbi:YciE/YciF ferroxidase family protein [Larkinella soli]|uniref:YciE/YciF ferroxidase family protein n=1 Tax=Larkinella soli TaxID=1770527 RepID=UPI0019D05D7D|nr:ferritin-like domain-containing protein [Larkinella soli]